MAHARWKTARDAEDKSRTDGVDDLKFSYGMNQWNDKVKDKRERKGRPCLTINRVGPACMQVTNNQRQQRPAIQVNPAGEGSTKDVAEVLQGMVRHIEVQSDAEVAWDVAFENMLRSGFKSPVRIVTEYVDENGDSNDQEIFIRPIINAFTVYDDPSAVMPDKSDRQYLFIVTDLSHDEYKAQFPDSDLASLTDMSSVGDKVAEWAAKDYVRVGEYFHVDYEEVQGKARKVRKPTIVWEKINAIEVLEKKKWAGKFIPFPQVVGTDAIVDGKRHTAGLVRDAKDPQRMYNVWNSKATEASGLAPIAPWVGWQGQFTDPKWEDANTETYAYLEAALTTSEGAPAPSLPERNIAEPPIGAFFKLIQQADNDIKATTGIYDASLGQKGPDESGKAILERKEQGDNATFGYSDNLARAMRFAGRILLDLIPKIYDAPRIQRIINPDGSVDHVGIYNSKNPNHPADFDEKTYPGESGKPLFEAIKKVFDIGVGKYDVTVSIGPSYQTKRQESAAMGMELMAKVPAVAQFAPDVVIREMDLPNGDAIADRVKKGLGISEDGDDSPEAQLASAQQKLQVIGQQHDLLVQELNKANEIIKTKQVETSGKIVIAKIEAAAKVTTAEIMTKAQSERARAELEQDEFDMLHSAANDLGLEAMKHSHNLEAGQQQADNAQVAAAQAAQNQPEGQPAQ